MAAPSSLSRVSPASTRRILVRYSRLSGVSGIFGLPVPDHANALRTSRSTPSAAATGTQNGTRLAMVQASHESRPGTSFGGPQSTWKKVLDVARRVVILSCHERPAH